MANSTSALIPWHDGHCTVALRSDRQVAAFDMVGPGRLLNQAYLFGGRWVEKGLGLTGHKLGMGPHAISSRIEKAFGDDSLTRQSRLDDMYDSFQNGTSTQRDRALSKECQKLLEYALPLQTPVTQVETFKQIITLTTRYPGLRRLFLQCPDIGRIADSPDAICEIWQNMDHVYDTESRFLLNFAANCLARTEPNIELEGIRPSKLGCASEMDLGVVDKLVVRHCKEGSGFPRLIAIRYIAATLELPAFWSENYQVQNFTMDKLCEQTLHFIEDINPESVSADDFELALFDPHGIDALADAILVGGKHWLQRQPRITELGPVYWLTNFVKLIEMLRGLILPGLLPSASRRAEEDWDALLSDISHELPMSSLDQFEDVFDFVAGRSGVLPSRKKPSDELRNGDAKGFSPMEASKVGITQDKDSAPASPKRVSTKNNIIIFGESGSGKSSLVNMIIGQEVAKVSAGPIGCTFENECYETHINDMPYNIHDTVGLNEGEEGRVPHWKAIQGLYTLIRQVDGVSLLIFCIRGRIKDNAHINWLFFFDVICDKKVPVIVVSTCWEQEENLEEAEARVSEALKKYSMDPKAIACIVSIWGRNNEHEEKYKQSQEKLRNLTMRYCMQEPWSKDKDEWFAQLYQKAFDLRLCLFAKSRLQFVEGIRLPFEEFKKNGNFRETDIDTLTLVLLQAEKRILKRRF